MNVELLSPAVTAEDFGQLVTLLTECVDAGASIGFLRPLPRAEAESYWRKALADLAGGQRIVLVLRAEPGREIVGSAQLVPETRANGRHRAEVQKVMVRPAHRRRGLAARVMAAVEAQARGRGVTLLVLDTSEGWSGAREFYAALGYAHAGGIPGYALDPDGAPAQNAIYFKRLDLENRRDEPMKSVQP